MLLKRLCLLILLGVTFLTCSTSQKIAMEPAKVLNRDVFTCKGLTEDQRWIGVTDEFLPEQDDKVVVVARMSPQDQDAIVAYELTNPMQTVVLTDVKRYPKTNILGIFYDMDRLLKLGEEGEWKANVYADGNPIGQAIFYIGPKPETTEEETGPRFVFVGEDSSTEEESDFPFESIKDRFGSYIHEVTPELTIPAVVKERLAPTTIAPATQ
ncbi:MAG: hypothetical protein C4527_00370 [Candidatus Omnitrophota bacterium]|nr:MAG: hypothetical protein C4527_00370 [Candidatus Omnitrophota bacterium]